MTDKQITTMEELADTMGRAKGVEVQYVLNILWPVDALPVLPTIVGPFHTQAEAEEWANLNVTNGLAVVHQLAYPYARSFSDGET